jgi:hypothetical protein
MSTDAVVDPWRTGRFAALIAVVSESLLLREAEQKATILTVVLANRAVRPPANGRQVRLQTNS